MKKETQKEDSSLFKTTVVCIIAAAVIFAAVIVLLVVGKSTNLLSFFDRFKSTAVEPLTKYTVSVEEDEDDSSNKTVVFTDDDGETYSIDGSDYMASLAEDRFIVLDNGKLVFFADGEEQTIAKYNVISCSISNDGSLIAFITPNSTEKIYIGTLVTYNTVTKDWTTVCTDAFVSTTSTIQISPSGDTVAYVRNYDEEALTYDCCYYKEGKETVIGQNRDVWAISDNADYIYYGIEDTKNYSSVFCVYTKDKGEVVLDEEGYFDNLYLNLDYSQCVYSKAKEEEPLYISREGSEGELYLKKAEDFDTSSLVEHVNKVINTENFE